LSIGGFFRGRWTVFEKLQEGLFIEDGDAEGGCFVEL
jgi:hypothetical protein